MSKWRNAGLLGLLVVVLGMQGCGKEEPPVAADSATLDLAQTRGLPLQVSLVKPQGEGQTDVTQIVFIFNKKMAELGDMEKSAQGLPIHIEPQPPCSWRWINTTTLACWLDQALPNSTRYQIRIGAELTALDGTRLGKEFTSEFSTRTIQMVRRDVEFTGPVNPVLTLSFNQPVDLAELQALSNIRCGRSEFAPVQVRQLAAADEAGRWDAGRSYVFSLQQDLPQDTSCNLQIKAGLTSLEGPLLSAQDFTVQFKTYPEFYVSRLSCSWRNETAGKPDSEELALRDCSPDYGVGFGFSVPTRNLQLADRIRVTPEAGWTQGGYGSPDYLRNNPDEQLSGFYLSSPFAGMTDYVVELLDGIEDIFGRPLQGARRLTFNTEHFKPSLQLDRSLAVMEKDGPYQLGYKSVNIRDFRLQLFSSQSPEDFDYLRLSEDYRSRCDEASYDPRKLYREQILQNQSEWDLAEFLPLDFKRLLPEHGFGYIIGRIDHVYDLEGKRVDVNEYGGKQTPACPEYFRLQITDLGITSKFGYFNSGAWVHSLNSGEALSDVQVQLIDESGQVLHRALTDADGFATFPGLKELDPQRTLSPWRSGTWYLVASEANDFAYIEPNQWNRGIRSYEFGVSQTQLSARVNFLMQAITDRPLYKPGDDVRIKLFARQWDHESLKLLDPQERKLFVEVANYRGDKVLERTEVALNDFSTGTLGFSLPRNAATGGYTIRVSNVHNHTLTKSDAFAIEEYRLPAFKVQLQAGQGAALAGDMLAVSGRAEYHFGGGVDNAKGYLNAGFNPGDFRPKNPELAKYRYSIEPASHTWMDDYAGQSTVVNFHREEIATDNAGHFSGAIKLPKDVITRFGHINIEAGFSDDSGKTIANRISTEVHPGEFYLGMRSSEWVYKPNEELGMQVLAVTPEEQVLSGKKVKLTLLQRKYNTVRRLGAGNYFHFETVAEDREVAHCEFVSAKQATACSLVPTSAGHYLIRARASDRHGQVVETSMSTFVTGSEYIGWWRYDHDRIDLVPEQKDYSLGDKLRVLVKSPYDEARALITVERHGILHREERILRGGAQVIELPLDRAAYAPGVYLSVILIKGRTSEVIEGDVDLGRPSFKMGMIAVRVNNPQTRLQLHSTTARSDYEPGEEVLAEISVTDSRGQGRESEVAIAVVDEALLQLAGDYMSKYEVHDSFYRMPALDMMTAETRIHLLGRRHFGKKGASPGGGGGEDGNVLRELFKAVAHWEPALLTDAQGKASFSFKAPDNLTGWRIIAVAVDRNHQFGSGGSSFKVNKKLMIESALPNFATEGDEFNARFVVHNRGEGLMSVDVNLDADGLELLDKGHARTDVAKDSRSIVQFPVKAQRVDEAIVEIRARSQAERDGMRLTLPITKFLSVETFGINGSTIQDRISEGLAIPEGIRTDVGGIELLLSSTVLSGLDDTFNYVLNYPYACWEQRLTRALMLRNNRDLAVYLNEAIRLESGKVDKSVQDILGDAGLYQAANGGFAYWKPQDELADPYLSAYTALAFHWLRDSGYAIDKQVDDKLQRYLLDLLNRDQAWPWYYTPNSKATIRAMIGYVMTQRGQNVDAPVSRLFDDRRQLSLFGQGFLMMAMQRSGAAVQAQVPVVRQEILNRAEIASEMMQFRESVDDGFSRILHSGTRSNCLLLTAMLEVEPDNTQLTGLMRFISTTRRANRWNNTQENLYCLNAMRDYAQVYERDDVDFKVSGSLGELELGKFEFDKPAAEPQVMTYAFTADDPGRRSEILLQREGSGRMYYTARMRFAYEQPRLDPVNAGMTIERNYFVRDGEGWQPVSNEVTLKRGDLVRVQLKVGIPAERVFVAMHDPLPAGLEPVNTALASASTVDAASGESDNSAGAYIWNEDDYWYGAYRSGGFYHRELRLQAVQYFADFIAPGNYELNYVAQAIATGTFNANPALVEEMYNPTTYGKGVPARFIIDEP